MSEDIRGSGDSQAASGLRASDADREQLAGELRDHTVAGRLDTDELEQRLQAAYSARTMTELAVLRRDLPATPEAIALAHRERRARLVRRSIQETGGSTSLFVVCGVIWVANGASGFFWPVWLLVLVALSAVRSGWELYGPGADLDAVEAKLDARCEHRHRDDDRRGRRDGRRQNRDRSLGR